MKSSDLSRLAQDLWAEQLHRVSHRLQLAQYLACETRDFEMQIRGHRRLYFSEFLKIIEFNGIELNSLLGYVLTPFEFQEQLTPRMKMDKRVARFLRNLRGKMDLAQFVRLVQVNKSTYFYWERGERRILFADLLKLLLHLNKVTLFLEGLGTSLKYETYGIPHRADRFNEIFFGNPWTPSIYLVLQTQFYLDCKRHSDNQIARKIGVTEDQVKQSISDLQLLHLIQFQGTHYQVVKGTFLAPPSSLTKNANVQNLKKYWMDRSAGFRDWPGIHRIEQATVSHETKEKILLWISELREKIAQEIKVTQPQTILHLHLQAFDLLADLPENIPGESKL